MENDVKYALEAIRTHLLDRHETIAVAESVTSGHLQAAMSMADHAAKFYQGGITTYNLGQKTRHLHVEPIHADSCNCVSERVAAEMALHVCEMFGSDWGIGIVGYATPVPECDVYTLFAHYAIAYKGHVIFSKRISSENKDAWNVQREYACKVLKDFAHAIEDWPKANSKRMQDQEAHGELLDWRDS
jgi:nicotinamide-nucleotide amidase